jgi:hypothetical protein
MVRLVDIPNVGVYEYPDDMSDEDIHNDVYDTVIPNSDPANPDPEQVRARPDLFPDIDRGSFFGGLDSGVTRLGRADEAAGAAIGRSQEELDSLKSQMSEDEYNQRYRASLDDVTGQWDKGEYWESAKTLFGDVLPQTLGESIPDMGIIGGGAIAGGLAGGAATGPLAPIGALGGAIIGGAIAGLPTFFGMNVERQIQENNITDPNEIETLKAAGAAAVQGGLEGLIMPVLGLIPGVKGMASKQVSDLVMGGVAKLTKKDMAWRVGQHALAGGATESITEVGQQMLERAQAGLDVTDPAALKEYIEAAVLGGLLGVGFGGVGGGVNVHKTKKGLADTYDMIEAKNAEQAQRLAGQERDLAEYVGAIPAQDAPLQIEARPELQLEPTNGDTETSGTETVQRRVNATEGEFNDRNEQRLVDEAMDPEQDGYNEAQRKTLHDVKIANEALQDERYTPEDLTATDETGEMVAPAIAQAITDRQAGQGNVTTEQNSYTIEELEALAKQGEVTGQNPEIVAEELQKLRKSRRPATELHNSINEQTIVDLAAQKNIKTGTKSFDALVKYITGAETLAEASPFRLTRMKETLDALPDGAFKGEPKDLINKREQSYSHGEFTEAVKRVLNNNKSSSGKIGQPKYTQALMKEVFPSKSLKEINDIRDEMVRIGLIRPNGKKKGSYLVDNQLMREEFIPANESVPDAKPIAAMDNKQDFTVEERTVPARDEEGNLKRDENGRPVKETGYHVVARPKKTDALNTGVEEVISIHNNRAEAEENAKRYGKAPSKVTRRMRNPETGRDKNMKVPTTSADLRGMAADPEMYAAEVRERTRRGAIKSAIRTRILDALNEVNERRGLQKLGIPVAVVDSVKAALGANSTAPEGTEGAYTNQMIYVGIDVALARVPQDTPVHEIERVVIQNLKEVLSHEQIHALKKLGILGPSDFKTLARVATTKTRPVANRMYGHNEAEWTYLDDVKASQPELANKPNPEAAYAEEAVAEMFRDWAKAPASVTGKPASLFRKIVKFFTTLGGFLKEQGVRSVDDIFGEIDAGTLKGDGVNAPVDTSGEAQLSVAPPTDSFSVGEDKAILAPAVKYKGRVSRGEPGQYHPQISLGGERLTYDEYQDLFKSGKVEEGYILSRDWGGGFVERKEAFTIAKEAGQLLYADSYEGSETWAFQPGLLSDGVKWSVADPAFKKWFSSANKKMKNEDGSPKEFYVGANPRKEFNTFEMGHETGATFISESAEFASEWAGDSVDSTKLGNRVYPVYAAMSDPFDFRDPVHRRMADEYITDKWRGELNAENEIQGDRDRLAKGFFGLIEEEGFIDWMKEMGFDGFSVVEFVKEPIGPGNPINWGVFKRHKIKSVFNQDFDAADPKFSVATKAMSDTELHDEVGKVEAAFYEDVSPEVQAYHDEVMREDADRRVQAAERDQAPLDPDQEQSGTNRPYKPRYTVMVWRRDPVTEQYLDPIPRSFLAADDIEARTLAASSDKINRDAHTVGEPYLDDPNWDADTQAPKFSVRRWRRVLNDREYKDAIQFVPIRPSKVNPEWDEYTHGMAWLDTGEPLPVVLLQGVDKNGAGFGRLHLMAKSDRFGDATTMAKKLEGLLANSHVRGSPNHRVKRYYGKDPAEHTSLDYQMTWKDPSDGTVYVLGLEKHTQDRVKYAAIVAFYPMDRADKKDAGNVASESDIQAYRRMRDEKFSVAPIAEYSAMSPANKVKELKKLQIFNLFDGDRVNAQLKEVANPKSKSTLVFMTPDEYRLMALRNLSNPEQVQVYANNIDRGMLVNEIPRLTFTDTLGTNSQVDSHEGRHRVRALEQLGFDLVPVILTHDRYVWGDQYPTRLIHSTELKAQDQKDLIQMPQSVIFPAGEMTPRLSEVIEHDKSEKYIRFFAGLAYDQDNMDTSVQRLKAQISYLAAQDFKTSGGLRQKVIRELSKPMKDAAERHGARVINSAAQGMYGGKPELSVSFDATFPETGMTGINNTAAEVMMAAKRSKQTDAFAALEVPKDYEGDNVRPGMTIFFYPKPGGGITGRTIEEVGEFIDQLQTKKYSRLHRVPI